MRNPLLIAFALLGCSDPAPSPVDATVDGAADVTPDVAPDVSQDAAPDGPPMVAPTRLPERVALPRWMIASIPDGTPDPVRVPLERGTFTLPPEGLRDDVDWFAEPVGEEGDLPPPPPRTSSYAATTFEAPEGTRCFALADRVLSLWINGAPLPGDVYGSGRIRLPLVTRGGENLLAIRAIGGRGAPRVRVWCTPDELQVNADDLTPPDFVVGQTGERWLGAAVLTLTESPALDVTARVEESDRFEATAVRYPALAGGAVTQVAFRLAPRRPFTGPEASVRVTLRVESPSLRWAYRQEVTVAAVATGTAWRQTRRSSVDGSVQYHAVLPPSNFDPARRYAMVLSLHGAGVDAIGQARAYAPKDWAYVVAPTNRRPFGFDWEVWGRLDGLEALDDATRTFNTAPDQVYVTGHSMGGHGTWQLGTLFPGRFATLGPSAGWGSFYSYTGRARPRGAFARSQASSDTQAYLGNLARRGVYAIHGTADDNVPIREGRTMTAAARMHTSAVELHEEPGAGHWWDRPGTPGADCVDWPALFAFMQARRLDPTETDFRFVTPTPAVSPRHSFVTVRSAAAPLLDVAIASARTGDAVALTTTNARSLTLDGAALRARGVRSLTVDGRAVELADGPVAVGPQDGKRPGQHGPFDEAMRRPWCLVYPDDAPAVVRQYAAFLISTWSVIGNGHGCALPRSRLTAAVRAERSIVYLGMPRAEVPVPEGLAITWDAQGVSYGGTRVAGAMAVVFPEGDGVSAAIVATPGSEWLLARVHPFTSGLVIPDWMVWSADGLRAAGFFSPTWGYVAPTP